MRSLNKAQLIGNLTRDPELRQTSQGTAICSFSVATNRTWKNSKGESQEEAIFHRVIAWSKLGEICCQLLSKGRKVFIEGRIVNRNWEDEKGEKHYVSEIVADDLILLDSKKKELDNNKPDEPVPPEPKSSVKEKKEIKEEEDSEDIPF